MKQSMINSHSRGGTVSLWAIAILVLALFACFLTPRTFAAVTPTALRVDITKFAFEPKEITVAPGMKVIWTNHDEVPHTVTSTDKSFISKALDTDDKFEYIFTREGDFDYYCVVHPYMTGIVHVRKQQLP
jgi:plastocyanin